MNQELHELQTHVNGATDLQDTDHTDQPVSIDGPESSNPSPLDVRDGKYTNDFNEYQPF